MKRVFLIFHSLKEPGYGRITKAILGRSSSCLWNTTLSHHRKFIKRQGQYLDRGILHDANLYFWGEYEPESNYIINSSITPKAVHSSLTSVRHTAVPTNALNTDPYVFGEHFKHICCRMGKKVYHPGDVLLFGNVENQSSPNYFFLDTVFVIKEKVLIDYSLNMTQYYKAAIEPLLHFGKDSFYRGEEYHPGKPYYSFVPCRLVSSPQPSPAYARINASALGFTIKKCWYGWTAASIPFSNRHWKMIQKEVLSSGWLIGTHIDKI